jgi:hypothetical protein
MEAFKIFIIRQLSIPALRESLTLEALTLNSFRL